MEGFSADQVMMRNISVELSRAGYHTVTFDFPDQSQSAAALGLTNIATDRLAFQSQTAKLVIMEASRLEAKQFIKLGHNPGLQLSFLRCFNNKLK